MTMNLEAVGIGITVAIALLGALSRIIQNSVKNGVRIGISEAMLEIAKTYVTKEDLNTHVRNMHHK